MDPMGPQTVNLLLILLGVRTQGNQNHIPVISASLVFGECSVLFCSSDDTEIVAQGLVLYSISEDKRSRKREYI